MTTEPAAAEQFEEFALRLVDAWGEAVSAYLDRMVPFIRSVAALSDDPQVQAELAARELARSFREYQPCHCLCGHRHPSQKGVCDMSAVTTVQYRTSSLGVVEVPICGPCMTARSMHCTITGEDKRL